MFDKPHFLSLSSTYLINSIIHSLLVRYSIYFNEYIFNSCKIICSVDIKKTMTVFTQVMSLSEYCIHPQTTVCIGPIKQNCLAKNCIFPYLSVLTCVLGVQ